MANPYRDGGGTLEDRLVALDEAIALREATFSADFWELAAPALGVARPPSTGKRFKAERKLDIAERVAARQDRLERLERAAGQLDDLEEAWRRPPDGTPPCQARYTGGERVLGGPPEWDALRDRFVFIAGNLFPEGRVRRAGAYALSLSVVLDGVAVEAMFDAALVSTGQGGSQAWELQIAVQVAVSPLAGELYVRPQKIGDEFLGLFGLRKEHTLGDQDFDGMFFVRGDDAAAKELLTEEVRAALLIIGREAVPHLVLNRGLARLHWDYEPRAPALESAVKVLAALRGAEPTRSLRAR